MRRLSIYAHHDAEGALRPPTVQTLRALRALSDRVVLVSTAQPPAAERDKVAGLVDALLERENVGFDFAMWKLALPLEHLARWDEIVLVNSSVVGPLAPLGDAFDRMEEIPCDFWGLTESHELGWHVQSYFLVFRRRAIEHPAFARFWREVEPLADKREVILRYEIGLSRTLRSAGLCGRALVAWWELPPLPPWRRLFPTRSPPLLFPRELLDAGVPFLKAELLRHNPGRARTDGLAARLARAGLGPPSPARSR